MLNTKNFAIKQNIYKNSLLDKIIEIKLHATEGNIE